LLRLLTTRPGTWASTSDRLTIGPALRKASLPTTPIAKGASSTFWARALPVTTTSCWAWTVGAPAAQQHASRQARVREEGNNGDRFMGKARRRQRADRMAVETGHRSNRAPPRIPSPRFPGPCFKSSQTLDAHLVSSTQKSGKDVRDGSTDRMNDRRQGPPDPAATMEVPA